MNNQVKNTRKLEYLLSKYGDVKSSPEENNKKIKEEWDRLKLSQIEYFNICSETFKSLRMSTSTLERISGCGSYLTFLANSELTKRKLDFGIFCKTRLCPTCAKRKSLKWIFALSLMIEYVNHTYNYEYLLLTLTAPNVKGEYLHDELKKYSKAFDQMLKRKKYKDNVKGFIRKLEITYNNKTETYHPHYHVILAVEKSYFKKGYINRDTWLKDWQRAMKDSSITQVDIRRVYNKSTTNNELNKTSIQSGILEVAKYTSKSGDYLISKEVFITFWNALKHMRQFTFGGVFKEAKTLLDNDELDYLILEDLTQWVYRIISIWNIATNQYDERLCSLVDIEKQDDEFIKSFEEMILTDLKTNEDLFE